MKLQKSSLLLIVMAIFLLISIGSACANENITTDGDIEVADDGTDVVLSNSDTVGNVPDDTNEDVLEQPEQEPTNTSIETGDNDTYKFSHDEEKSIPVQVKANNTHIDVNKSDLKISEGNKDLAFEYNNTYVTIKEILTVGNHTITISYQGINGTYINSTKIITLQVSGNNTIETQTSIVCNGKNIEIPVKVHDGVEYIELIKSNFNLTLVYTNESGNISNLTITNFTVNDGKIKFDTPAQLIAASLIIEHVNATGPKTVNIKISTEVKAEADKDKFKSEEVKNISITILNGQENRINVTKNDLEVFENGTSINFTYNNSKITLELGVGTHNLTIKYKGNETYNASSADVIVKVSGNNTIITDETVYSNGETVEVPVKIFDGSENITLNNNLTVKLTYTNETGNVTTKNMTYTIDGDKITLNPDVKLIAASITLNYPNAEAKTVAIKLITNISANVDAEKYNVKDNKTITIKLVDGQNNPLNITANDLKVLENGANVAFTYNNSVITITTISEGAHNLTIVYTGNETYNTTNTTVEMKVFGANQINVPAFVVSEDGKSFEIPIYIFNGLENITITEGNFTTMNLTYTDETGNVTTKAVTFTYDNNGTIKVTTDIALNKASLTVDYIDSASAKTVKINLATKVNATPDYAKYRFNETDNITVAVYDYAGNNLNITKNDLQVLDNGKNIAFNYNNSIITVNLGEGVHNLTIVYKGNETYNSSSIVIKRGVSGDLRFDPDKTAVLDENTQITITINLNDAVDPQTIEQAKLNITVFWTLGNQTFNRTVKNIKINGQNVTFKMDVEFDSAYAVIKYSENNLTANTTIKANTEIKVNDGSGNITKGETEDKTLNITITGLTGDNGHNINITKNNIEIWNGAKKLNIEVNGTKVTIKDALKFGVYNLTVKYLGDNTFIASSNNVTLTVYGINATSSINVNSSKKGEVKVSIIIGNETATIDVNELILNVTYKNGNDTIVIPVTADKYENGTLYFTLENGNFTTATLNIKYYETEKNVTLNRIYNAQIVVVNNKNEYKTGNFTFRLVDVDDGSNITGKTIRLTTVGNIRAGFSATTDANGIASFRTINLYEFNNTGTNGGAISLSQIELDVGNHSVDLETEGNVKATKVTTNLTITQGHFKIVVDPYKEYYGTDKPVTVTVTNSLGEPVPGVIVKLTIDKLTGEYYLYTNTSGVGRISIYNTETKSGLVGGDYVFTVSNNDTVNIAKTTSKGTVTVVKIPTKISAKDVTVQYNSGTTSTIKITDKKTGKAVSGMYVLVRLYSTSKKYNDYLFQTNSKGQIAFSASLTVGKHKMVVSSADNRYSASSVTKTITVKKATAKITAKKVTDYYKGAKYFTVKLTNTKNKKAIYDAKINIKIFVSKNRYYNYNGNTGMNGKIKLALDSLKPGSYKVEVSGADSKDFTAKKVTSKIVIKKATAKLTPKKLTAKKGAKKYFKVTVKNKKTKKVIKGVKLKVKVYTGKKAKTYKVKTNSKGVAKLSTAKLKVGKHKVVVTSANKYVKAKKAKSTIKIKK